MTNSITINVPVILSTMELDIPASVTDLDLTVPVDVGQTVPAPVIYYGGEYEVTPSTEPIVISTRQKYLSENITVNPIPHNYGLVSWNGLGLRIS